MIQNGIPKIWQTYGNSPCRICQCKIEKLSENLARLNQKELPPIPKRASAEALGVYRTYFSKKNLKINISETFRKTISNNRAV